VHVSDEYGNNRVCPLPVVNNKGVYISIEDLGDSIAFNLKFKNIPDNGNGYSIVGHMQHQVAYQANLKRTTSDVSLKIPTSELQNGILHLTVFDPLNHPVAERLIFVNHHKLVYDSTAVSQYNLSTERRGTSEIQVKSDSISWSSYSVSVSDANSPSSVGADNLLSTLWLTSDISSPLLNAASYFRDFDKNKNAALDAIMISEKWNRFKWDDILNNNYPVIKNDPLSFLSYTGRVTSENKLRRNEDLTLLLYYHDSSSSAMLVTSDSVGNIVLDNLVFYDELKVFYQLNNKKDNATLMDINFERNNKFIPYSLPFPKTPYFLAAPNEHNTTPAWVISTVNNLKTQRGVDEKYSTLQEVVVNSKIKSPKEQLNEQLSSGRFKTTNETIFDFVNENQTAVIYPNILQWLNGRVAGLRLSYQSSREYPFPSLRAIIREGEAAIFVDEMKVDPGYLESLSINEIAMVKVIKGSAYALQAGVVSGGIIAIYTNRMGLRITQKKPSPSLPNYKIKGYDKTKEFFLPDYKNKDLPQPGVDNREQLLWQTSLFPSDTPDKATVKFFNNDNATRFRIIVQGFSNKGIPVYYEKIIEPPQKGF
jgi:hypothetical protein